MHRIDTPTAQKDKWGAGKNGYTNGDPAVGIKSTALNAEIFDALQEEICNVIEKSGLTLDPNNNSQLYEVLSAAIGEIGNYLKIGNNLSEIADKGSEAQKAARDNIGCGTAATSNADDFVRKTGDLMTGTLDVKSPFGVGWSVKEGADAPGQALGIFNDAEDKRRGYIGYLGGNRVEFYNNHGAGIQLQDNGDVLISPGPDKAVRIPAQLVASQAKIDGFLSAGSFAVSAESTSKYQFAWRMAPGLDTNKGYGAFWHHDNSQTLYLMCTRLNDPGGSYTNARPFILQLNTGRCLINNGLPILNVSLGAQVQIARDGSGNNQAPSGHAMTGLTSKYNDSNWEVQNICAKPIQVTTDNGSWRTIGG